MADGNGFMRSAEIIAKGVESGVLIDKSNDYVKDSVGRRTSGVNRIDNVIEAVRIDRRRQESATCIPHEKGCREAAVVVRTIIWVVALVFRPDENELGEGVLYED